MTTTTATFPSTPYTLWWTDGRNRESTHGGDYKTEEEAEAAIDEWRSEMLSYCDDDEDRAEVLAGTFTITREDG